MKTVAIISEYNPFHRGHLYQIEKIREELGSDTAIIAIMSGNITQRAELAIMDKGYRARAAVLSGVNLVLEIPFPYSSSSAEFYANAGVEIAERLGTVDYLSFGSETGDIDKLISVATAMKTDEYRAALAEVGKSASIGYAKAMEKALLSVFPSDFDFTPNNILALEYIKALKEKNSKIKPHTVKRYGTGYNDGEIKSGELPSALAIRELYRNGNGELAKELLPNGTSEVISDAKAIGDFPADLSRLSSAIISHLRLNLPHTAEFHEAGGGLYNRLVNKSYEANDINNLLSLMQTKKFTNARIRRAMWNSFFGVTSSDLKVPPRYTQILAMDEVGASCLRKIRKTTDFPILTKPSDKECLFGDAVRQKALSDTADAIYDLAKPKPKGGGYFLKFTPFVKK